MEEEISGLIGGEGEALPRYLYSTGLLGALAIYGTIDRRYGVWAVQCTDTKYRYPMERLKIDETPLSQSLARQERLDRSEHRFLENNVSFFP